MKCRRYVDRDRFLPDELRELLDPRLAHVERKQGRPVGEGAGDGGQTLSCGARRQQHDAIFRGDRVHVRIRDDISDRLPMRLHHPLRFASRTRGVDEAGQVPRCDFEARVGGRTVVSDFVD
jgi:hypothetical protein